MDSGRGEVYYCLTLYFGETLQFIIKSCYKSCLLKLYPTKITIKKRNLKAEGGNKSLYATRLAINLYWAYWLMGLAPYVARPTSASAPVKINLPSLSHK
jgi:hypothetical protein